MLYFLFFYRLSILGIIWTGSSTFKAFYIFIIRSGSLNLFNFILSSNFKIYVKHASEFIYSSSSSSFLVILINLCMSFNYKNIWFIFFYTFSSSPISNNFTNSIICFCCFTSSVWEDGTVDAFVWAFVFYYFKYSIY